MVGYVIQIAGAARDCTIAGGAVDSYILLTDVVQCMDVQLLIQCGEFSILFHIDKLAEISGRTSQCQSLLNREGEITAAAPGPFHRAQITHRPAAGSR